LSKIDEVGKIVVVTFVLGGLLVLVVLLLFQGLKRGGNVGLFWKEWFYGIPEGFGHFVCLTWGGDSGQKHEAKSKVETGGLVFLDVPSF